MYYIVVYMNSWGNKHEIAEIHNFFLLRHHNEIIILIIFRTKSTMNHLENYFNHFLLPLNVFFTYFQHRKNL